MDTGELARARCRATEALCPLLPRSDDAEFTEQKNEYMRSLKSLVVGAGGLGCE